MDTVLPQLKLNKCFTLLTDAKGLYGLSTLACLLAKISNNVENGSRLENAATRCFFIRRKLGLTEISDNMGEFQYNVMTTNSIKLLDSESLMDQAGLDKFAKRRRTRGPYKPIMMKPTEIKREEESVPIKFNNEVTSAPAITAESEIPKMAIPILTSDSNKVAPLQDIYGDLNNSIFPYFSINSFSLEKAINECPFLKSKVEVGGSSNQSFHTTSQQPEMNTELNFNQNTSLFVQPDTNDYFNSLNFSACNNFTDHQQTVDNDQYISIPQFNTKLEHQQPTATKIKPKVKANQLKPKKYKTANKGKYKDSINLNGGTKSITNSKDSSEATVSYVKSPENLSATKDDDEVEENERVCFNCKATSTPLWRRTPDNQRLCNACGLYHKLHNKHRPLELKKSRDAKKPPYKPRSLVCSNCHTNSASLWRRDADTGNPVCNPCGLFKRLNHKERPAHLYTNVIKKRHRNLNNSNNSYSIPSKDQSIKEETSPPQYTTTPVNENRPISLVQTPDNTDQLNQTNNQPQLFATSSNPLNQMHNVSNNIPFAVYPQYPANFNSMQMPLFNLLAPSLPNAFNLLNPQPYNLLNINPLINFQQAYEANFQHLGTVDDLTQSNNLNNLTNPFTSTTTATNLSNDTNTDQDLNKTSFSDFLSYP